jgi:hypothetical protein
MKILKLDGRFANYPRYKYALQFHGRTKRAIMLEKLLNTTQMVVICVKI